MNNGTLPCFATMQFSGIDATQAAGNAWNLRFNYVNQQAAWPIITGSGSFNTPTPMLLIDSDVTPSEQDEQTYLIPVTQRGNNESGFLQLQYSNGAYSVVGFLGPNFVSTGTNTAPKVTAIDDGTQFYLRAYAKSDEAGECFTGSASGTWCLMPIQRIIEAPLSISFGALPQTSAYNKIAFLVADLTGALNLTQTTLAYPPP